MSEIPRSTSGARNVARSLATATSESIAISRPPPWQMPFTAATTGAQLWRPVVNGKPVLTLVSDVPMPVTLPAVPMRSVVVKVAPVVMSPPCGISEAVFEGASRSDPGLCPGAPTAGLAWAWAPA